MKCLALHQYVINMQSCGKNTKIMKYLDMQKIQSCLKRYRENEVYREKVKRNMMRLKEEYATNESFCTRKRMAGKLYRTNKYAH